MGCGLAISIDQRTVIQNTQRRELQSDSRQPPTRDCQETGPR